jgi:hypothetical protein
VVCADNTWMYVDGDPLNEGEHVSGWFDSEEDV